MHWADSVAENLAKRGDHHIIATGITPSGPIHVGNMREVVIADMITRACEDQGLRAELVYIADTADPLRKVYPFLDQETYQPHVGKSLAEIPAPDGKGSYAEHFIAPFLSALEEIDIHPRVIDNHAAYQKGEFVSALNFKLTLIYWILSPTFLNINGYSSNIELPSSKNASPDCRVKPAK